MGGAAHLALSRAERGRAARQRNVAFRVEPGSPLRVLPPVATGARARRRTGASGRPLRHPARHRTGAERVWRLRPPADDAAMETANFHSGFYFEEDGGRYLGLLRTGALLESLEPHSTPVEHSVLPAPASTIWIIRLDDDRTVLQAQLLPGIKELDALALSHLDVDASGGDGFVLYANFKEADVAEETHGPNVYSEPPEAVAEHYSGMIVEALNFGLVLRYERRGGRTSVRTFARPYDPGRASLGHSWLPINIQLDPSRKRLFCSFSGFRPRLLPRHIASAYPERVVDAAKHAVHTAGADPVRRGNARTRHRRPARPHLVRRADGDDGRRDGTSDYVCTFSPEVGLGSTTRRPRPNDLPCRVPRLMSWRDTHSSRARAHLVRPGMTAPTGCCCRAGCRRIVDTTRAVPREAWVLGGWRRQRPYVAPLPNLPPTARPRRSPRAVRGRAHSSRGSSASVAVYHSHPGGTPRCQTRTSRSRRPACSNSSSASARALRTRRPRGRPSSPAGRPRDCPSGGPSHGPGHAKAPQMRGFRSCAEEDSNLHGGIPPQGPQPCASTNSATGAGRAQYRRRA